MMKPFSHPAVAATALATVLVGLPAALSGQDTYYVLFAHNDEARQVLLSVHNPTDAAVAFDLLPIGSGANGTLLRPERPKTMSVPAGRTIQYTNLAGTQPSMVELVAHGQLAFQAYTMHTDSNGRRVGLREQVPIIDSRNMVPGGTRAFVTGIRRDTDDRSDYAIVNLSHSSNACEHQVRGHDGNWALESQVLTHRPLSLTYVADVLKVVGIDVGDHYTISTKCTGNFYVAGLVADEKEHRLTILQPFLGGASTLRPPGSDDPGGPDNSCAPGNFCVDLPGPFRATIEKPSYSAKLEIPAGVYQRALFRFRLHHGGWDRVPSRRHLLFWFARDRHTDLFGFGQARAGGSPQVFFRSDFGVLHDDKQRVTTNYLMQPGETYDFVYDFDTANSRIVLTITDSRGVEVLRSEGRPNIAQFSFSAAQRLAIGFGFPGTLDFEPAQPGWIWSNLHIELQPR